MKKWGWFLVSLIVVGLDQASKYWVLSNYLPYQPEPILPFFNLTLAFNTGAAFSFLSGAGDWHRWFFAFFSLGMSLGLIIWMTRLPTSDRLHLSALSLIVGGAVGNLLDRLFLGHVVDFIDVFYQNYHWPIFNLADSAIFLGALLLLLDLILGRNVRHKEA